MNLGANPVNGERHESHVVVRIEAFDGLHEPDVAFLNQIVQRQAVTRVAFCDMHDESQVGHDQITRCVEVFVVA